MFDFSFGELAIIGAVALVVIGPEKLPKVARTAGMLFGRAQRMAAGFRADLERELRDSEIAQLQKDLSQEAAQFRDEMAESAATVSTALSESEQRILPDALPEHSPEQIADPAPAKPRRTRKKTEPASSELPSTASDEITDQTSPVEPLEAAATPKKPRKRPQKAAQVDMFTEPVTVPLDDVKDRR